MLGCNFLNFSLDSYTFVVENFVASFGSVLHFMLRYVTVAYLIALGLQITPDKLYDFSPVAISITSICDVIFTGHTLPLKHVYFYIKL